MEFLRIISLAFLLIIDIVLIIVYTYQEEKETKNVILIFLTLFVLPTIYIILK